MIVHQIFGLLGDDVMPDLFKTCQAKVLKWCEINNYSYRLWDKKSCERLIKKYPEFLDLYYSVKFPIMKVDIIRFIILHYYGGLYLDLDVEPNIVVLKDYDFACAKCLKHKGLKKCDWIKNKSYEIEILQSCACNSILTDYLRYVKTQIKEKDEIDVYETWKVRYVLQTTGPMSFNRFMKDKKIETYTRRSGTSNDLNDNANFISHPSESYVRNGKMITD